MGKLYHRVSRTWIAGSLECSQMSSSIGPLEVTWISCQCVCVCVCMPARVKGVLKARWGKGVGAPTVWHIDFHFALTSPLHFPGLACQVQVLWRQSPTLCPEAKKGWLHRCTRWERSPYGLKHAMGRLPTDAPFHIGFTLASLLEFSLLYKPQATQSSFRVKQLCSHLSASNWLSPFFLLPR